jgi:putative transposase
MIRELRPGGHAVKKCRCTDKQIAYALKQAKLRTQVAVVCRKMGMSDATFHTSDSLYNHLRRSR